MLLDSLYHFGSRFLNLDILVFGLGIWDGLGIAFAQQIPF